jgi:hypothetical protein
MKTETVVGLRIYTKKGLNSNSSNGIHRGGSTNARKVLCSVKRERGKSHESIPPRPKNKKVHINNFFYSNGIFYSHKIAFYPVLRE